MELKRYLEIQHLCNKDTYGFLHKMKSSPEKFNLQLFFEYLLDERDIVYIEQPFSSNKIVGHYKRDELGKSIMINTANNRYTRKVGSGHEIGHDTLHSNSTPSQDFRDGIESLYHGKELIEQEANSAAMMYYAPDISIYTLLSDPIMTFSEMSEVLDIPYWLLKRRIIRYLQINCMMVFEEAERLVNIFIGKIRIERGSLLQEMVRVETFEEKVIREFTDTSFFTEEKNIRSTMESISLFAI